MKREQLNWLLSPKRGAHDMGEVGVLWVLVWLVGFPAALIGIAVLEQTIRCGGPCQ